MKLVSRTCQPANITGLNSMSDLELIEVGKKPLVEPAIDADFQKTIEESKAAIQNEKQKVVKKGRGRPRKSGDAPTPQTNTSPQQSPGLSPAAPPDLKQYLVPPMIAISKIPATKHQIPELALSQDEAEACAIALNQCLQAFIPDVNTMSPKTAAIVSLALTVGTIGFQKYSIYQDKKPKVQKPEPTVQEKNAAAPTVSHEDYFTRPR